MTIGAGNVGGSMASMLSTFAEKRAIFQNKLNEVRAKGESLSQEDLISLQYEMGSYTTFVEALSNIQKGIIDTLKSLAQKV